MLFESLAKIWKLIPRKGRIALSRATHAKFTASAAGIITNEDGHVLLLNHILRPTAGWGLPGGFFDRFEQPEAALRREIREETGLELRDPQIYRARTVRRHIEIYFTAKGVGIAEVKSREINDLGWFPIDNMPPGMSLDQQFLIRRALGADE